MLTEEGHHMFIGTTGIQRVVTRTLEVMKEIRSEEPDKVRAAGAIDLPTIQRYLNFHYSVSLDLFGQELSTNAANYYTAGLKGRFEESRNEDDHVLSDDSYNVTLLENNEIREIEQNRLLAVNERLRDDYIADCQLGVTRWSKIIKKAGVDFELALPHRGFKRHIGSFAGARISPSGKVLTEAEWTKHSTEWLPSQADREFVLSLMTKPVTEPGKFAGWVALRAAASTASRSISSM